MDNNTSGNERLVALVTAITVVMALIVRLLHVVLTERFNPLAPDLVLDAAIYDRWARSLLSGGTPEPTRLMQAPLYPWFLVLLYRIAGSNLMVARLVHALLGTATCALTIVVTKRLFRSPLAVLVTGLLAALYLPALFYEGVLVPATLIVFLNALFLSVLVTGAGPPGRGRLLLAGIVLGLSVTAKPVALLLLPFAVLHLHFSSRIAVRNAVKSTDTGTPRRCTFASRIAFLLVGLVIALTPLVIRNAIISGRFIPLTTGGGINFYIGNNPGANGYYALPRYEGTSLGATPDEQRRNMYAVASAERGRELSPGEVSSFWLRAGMRYLSEQPRRGMALWWRKFLFFWNSYERANVENLTIHRRFRGVLQLPLVAFGIIAPLGIIGIFLTRQRWRAHWLLYGGIVAYLAAALVFYVLARYRLPVVPFLVPFAGAGIAELVRLARKRRIAELVLSLAALALLFSFSNARVAADTPEGLSSGLTRVGNAYSARGDTTQAVQAYREALARDPRNDEARHRLKRRAPP